MVIFLIAFSALFVFLVKVVIPSFSSPPDTFTQNKDLGTFELKLKYDFSYDELWQKVVNITSSRFNIKTQDKNKGYILTEWSYPALTKLTKNYRMRCAIQFGDDRYSIKVNVEAEFHKSGFFGIGEEWLTGTDEPAVQGIKDALTNGVGRTS